MTIHATARMTTFSKVHSPRSRYQRAENSTAGQSSPRAFRIGPRRNCRHERKNNRSTSIWWVTNPNPDPDKGEGEYYSYCSTKTGVYLKPLALVKRDDLGNPISSKINGQKAMFYIPFMEQNVRKVLEEFNYEYKGLALAIAKPGGGESWYGSHTYTIYNLDEFLHSSFDDALGANQGGFLKDKMGRVVTEGAVHKYVMDKAAKREQAEKEFNEFKERQQSKTKRK